MRRTPKRPTLLWGVSGDDVLHRVQAALRALGIPTLFLDQRRILESAVDLVAGDPVQGVLRFGPWTCDLGDVRAVYFRPYDSRRLPVLQAEQPGSFRIARACNFDELLASFADVTPALVINRPSAMAANNSKPFQALQASKAGFATPETLITTDMEAVLAFRDQHQQIIFKSISGTRSVVTVLTDEHLKRMGRLRTCPTQFQERVEGVNYRVHVVGLETYVCRIISSVVDYRYDPGGCIIEAATLPEEVAERAVALTKESNLNFAGLDLMKAHDGRWYCFEVNPSPGFTFFENATSRAIPDAIARLVSRAPT